MDILSKVYAMILSHNCGHLLEKAYKKIIFSMAKNRRFDELFIYYACLVVPLLLLSTPHARFGSILIFFHYYFFTIEENANNQ